MCHKMGDFYFLTGATNSLSTGVGGLRPRHRWNAHSDLEHLAERRGKEAKKEEKVGANRDGNCRTEKQEGQKKSWGRRGKE